MNQTDETIVLLLSLLAEAGHLSGDIKDPAGLNLRELGLDSLSVLELLMLIDERTGVEIAVEEVEGDASVADLAELIGQRRKG